LFSWLTELELELELVFVCVSLDPVILNLRVVSPMEKLNR